MSDEQRDERPRYVVVDEPDVDADEMIAIWRKASRAWGVRPHPDRVAEMHADLDLMRPHYPADVLVELEIGLWRMLQLQAIDAHADYRPIAVLTENGVGLVERVRPEDVE
ncbi:MULTISPECIES: hypothetical protein [Prauserella salsuginis group]|uniref:Uncharacterized protein n=1 Tax=Prauserella salsuginis TaxID=387889 RepID=A0ABW6FZT9_9PSEU|nr:MULTISPECIES: hypothetical protein [Prauserella salsuginis group]MCR3720390.1 hypothetical protein [Prauserella flava]MCR3733901.1 hypothetical protein [Prauserella salsuginis]